MDTDLTKVKNVTLIRLTLTVKQSNEIEIAKFIHIAIPREPTFSNRSNNTKLQIVQFRTVFWLTLSHTIYNIRINPESIVFEGIKITITCSRFSSRSSFFMDIHLEKFDVVHSNESPGFKFWNRKIVFRQNSLEYFWTSIDSKRIVLIINYENMIF